MSAVTGHWIANIGKSRRHANHQFQSATLTIDITGSEVSLTHAGVNMSGKHESGHTVLNADRQPHPVSPQAPGVVAVTQFVDARTLLTEASKDGRMLGRATYAVSEDGRTLTATVAGIDAAGKSFDQVIVFDRES
jgi:hypothetical protein